MFSLREKEALSRELVGPVWEVRVFLTVGSTFLGLSQKLLGTQDFEALIQMACEAPGTESVDLLFHEYYKDERDKQSIQGKEQFVCISLSNITRMSHEQINNVE